MAGDSGTPLSGPIEQPGSSQRLLLPNGNGAEIEMKNGFDNKEEEQVELEPNQQQQQQGRRRIPGISFLGRISVGYSTLASQAQMTPAARAILSPSATFRRLAAAREVVSLQTPSEQGHAGIRFREGVNLPVVGEIRWKTMKIYAMEWLRNPKNLALLAWILVVAVSGAILFMVMTGMLNKAIPKKSVRDTWYEVNNQILNALFTLMCLYLHPRRFLHLYQLFRWSPHDVVALRKVYCKDGLRKPHEWGHMLVVVFLLHLNCFSQYALCGLQWGYRRANRPAIGVAVCLAFAIGAAAAAGIYNMLSPLGRDYDYEDEEEHKLAKLEMGEFAPGTARDRRKMPRLYRRKSFASKGGKVVEQPEWQGGLFDCCMDREVAFLSTFCGFCVFGWNMDRLGFGNRFVHIATFLLICSAPYWIFLLAAGNIDNKFVRQGLGLAGIVLSVFGLLYGGFWRIKMRTTYGLPAQKWCCGQANVTDCTQWMFCSFCALCQEVRTAEHYVIHDDKFYVKRDMASPSPGMSPLGRERAFQAPAEAELGVQQQMEENVKMEENGCMDAPLPAATLSKEEEEELAPSFAAGNSAPPDAQHG